MSRDHRSTSARRLLMVAALAGIISCDPLTDPPYPDGPGLAPGAAPLRSIGAAGIPDRYVVVFRSSEADPRGLARRLADQTGGDVQHVYEHAIKGFSVRMPAQALNGIRNHPSVAYVAEDALAYLAPATMPAASLTALSGTQDDATWGLDRIDQRALPLDGTFTYGPTGAGVTAYVIDSGILPTHQEFGGRARIGADFVGDGMDGIDCNGHGTHVAGTLGGATYGVARDVELVAVRVFACEGPAPYSVIIAAVDWVTADADGPAVVNMSLGGGYYEPMNDAVRASIEAGHVYALAAGNDGGADACTLSPAATAEAITVGSTTAADARSGFSNTGPCVDVFAPGSGITSAWSTGDTDLATISGTSMATPHVAGVAALYLESDPSATPEEVAAAIMGAGTRGRIADVGPGSPDLLLFSPLTAPPSGPVIGLQPNNIRFNVILEDAPGATGAGADLAGLVVRSGGRPSAKDFGAGAAALASGESVSLLSTSRGARLTNLGDRTMTWTATSDATWLTVDVASGTLEPGEAIDLVVSADTAGLGEGSHQGAVTVEADGALNGPRTVAVTLAILRVVDLESGVPITDLAGAAGSERLFRIRAPEGTASLLVETFGGTGDLDIFLRYGDVPDPWHGLYDCGSWNWGNDEFCMLGGPPPGDWLILVLGWTDYSGATLVATTQEAAPIMDLWPLALRFQQFLDPATGEAVGEARAPRVTDRDAWVAGRKLGAKTFAPSSADAPGPASTLPAQPIWLGNMGSGSMSWTAETDRSWLGVSPVEGSLGEWESVDLMATADPAGLEPGDHHGAITVQAPAAINPTGRVEVTLSIGYLELLELGVPVEDIGGASGSMRVFRVTVPEGLPALEVRTTGGSGDPDLFLRHGSPPDIFTGWVDCWSASWGTEERCVIQNPAPGDWYVLLFAFQAYEGVTMVAEEGQPVAIMELDPPFLFFQRLIDPATGGVVATPAGRPDRATPAAARTLGEKTFGRPGRAGTAAPASFDAEQSFRVNNAGTATLDWSAGVDQPWIAIAPASGSLEPSESQAVAARVDAAGLPEGYSSGMVSVADPDALNSPQPVWVDVLVSRLRTLQLGVPTGITGDWDTGPQYYRVAVPHGATDLSITTSGGTGDVDLFVRHGGPPDLWWWEFDCLSGDTGNNERCDFADPAGGDWYILVYPFSPFEGVTLEAAATVPWTLERLADQIARLRFEGALSDGIASSLDAKVAAALQARDSGQPEALDGVLGALDAELRGLARARLLDTATAALLLEAVAELRAESSL